MEYCAEKCRFDKNLCNESSVFSRQEFPAPVCKTWSTTLASEIYYPAIHAAWWRNVSENWGWSSEEVSQIPISEAARKETIKRVEERNKITREIVRWAARQVRLSLGQQESGSVVQRAKRKEACEDLDSKLQSPMMFPDEFEFVAKSLARLRPQTYLEWGSGQSTSFYPLFASEKAIVLENYPPWCAKVLQSGVVQCLTRSRRMRYVCKAPVWPNGTAMEVMEMGTVVDPAARLVEARNYVALVEHADIDRYDAALVDGRYRVACALKLLAWLNENSVLILHDFWERQRRYGYEYYHILKYYDVIGRTRSIALLRKKEVSDMPGEGEGHLVAYKQYFHLHG
eukprot:CAMPEP_0170186324 /NCGR_PEP_ID=MMETSP0040_2-20121228/38792_1 /TAXON_ID=641309 /ORGANISM="Lotharella oceanica, Strain CCMP622" /LENGTH=340 /DNA_ID=CAMNT_0010433015 /DNA_START=22 /DNA_END=1044 /DNA_ORIENTATION=-